MAIPAVSASSIDFAKLTEDLKRLAESTKNNDSNAAGKSKSEFLDLLEKGLKEVNTSSQEAEKASMDLATGKSSNVHETMLAVTKAELGFNMMVQMRNKVIEAYQEVMRMQV